MASCRNRPSVRPSIPSPNGALLATLQRSRLLVRSTTSNDFQRSWSLPEEFTTNCSIIQWTRSQDVTSVDLHSGTLINSTRILLTDDETIRIYDVTQPTRQATINGAASNLGKIADVAFGFDSNEILVFSDFGVKFTIWSLLTSRGVEIRDPKYMVACYDHRPKTGHLALLTRAAAQDIMMLLKPGSHEALNSVELGTVDAQEVRWSLNGHWIAVRDAASAGHKVQIYTADGHLFRTVTGFEHSAKIELGVKCISWTMAGTLLIGDNNAALIVLSKNIFSPIAHLIHKTPISLPDIPIWEEQIDASRQRSYTSANQPAAPPTLKSSTKPVAPKVGISLLACNTDGTLLATKNDAVPTTTWIWSLQSSELVAILIHHSPIKQLTWHMHQYDLLLMRCVIPEPSVHIWKSAWDHPKVITLPMEKVSGRLEASWLQSPHSDTYRILLSSQTQSTITEVSHTGEIVTAVSDPEIGAKSTATGAEDMFDEGNSIDLSPIKFEGSNGAYFPGSGFDMTDDGIDDTFQYRRQARAMG